MLDPDDLKYSTTGERLVTSLALESYKFVYICRIINITFPFYIIYYDSRRSSSSISPSKIKKLKFFNFFKIKNDYPYFDGNEIKISLPYDIRAFNEYVKTNSLMITLYR